MKKKKKILPDLEEIMPLLIGIWRKFRKEAGPPDRLQTREFRSVVESIKWLRSYFDKTHHRSPIENYFNDRQHVSAYILYFWVLHYLEGLSVIQELPSPPRRVLDLCSGPASLAFSALKAGAQEVVALDRNKLALELGAEICGKYGFPLTIRQWEYPKKIQVEGKFDLILFGHAIEELFPSGEKGADETLQEFIKELFSYLTPDGYLLILDSSKFEMNRRLLKLRETLVQQGYPLQAPCVWKGLCPALASPDSPCYAQREFDKPYLIKEIQRASQINLGSLKMSYFIFKQPEGQWPLLPDRQMFRVVSPPVETFHGKRYYLCGTEGGMRLESHLKEHPKESKAFEYLRRGDLISFEEALIKPQGIDIIQGTKVKIEAATGKPLPIVREEEEEFLS